MKAPSRRTLIALVLLACAAEQPVLASGVVASALALGLHAHGHVHQVAWRSDGDHLDLVLSHDTQDAHDAEHPGNHTSARTGKHVVHLAASSSGSATPRRARLDLTPLPAIPVALPVVPAPVQAVRPASEPRALGTGQLRTVVLRL